MFFVRSHSHACKLQHASLQVATSRPNRARTVERAGLHLSPQAVLSHGAPQYPLKYRSSLSSTTVNRQKTHTLFFPSWRLLLTPLSLCKTLAYTLTLVLVINAPPRVIVISTPASSLLPLSIQESTRQPLYRCIQESTQNTHTHFFFREPGRGGHPKTIF